MNLLGNNPNALSILKDPFSTKCITDVMLRWTKMYDGRVWVYATVCFTNGDTKGEQKIEAESMEELIKKVDAFVKSLAAS